MGILERKNYASTDIATSFIPVFVDHGAAIKEKSRLVNSPYIEFWRRESAVIR